MNIEDLIPPVAQMLGIEPATALLLLGLLVAASNVASKVIPDSATGALGVIRKIASIIGLSVGNRIAAGVSVNDVAKAVITRKVTEVAAEIPADVKRNLREKLDREIG